MNLPPATHVFGDIAGDSLYAATTYDAPRGRVVRIPLASLEDVATWAEVVPESSSVIDSVAVVDESVVVGALDDASARITVYDFDGQPRSPLPLTHFGAISSRPMYLAGVDPMFQTDDGGVAFLHHALNAAPVAYRYDIKKHELKPLQPLSRHPSNLMTMKIAASSSDGERVPLDLLFRQSKVGLAQRLTLFYAYGGPYSLMPGYQPELAAFAEAGGVVALVHCRGGTEFGAAWAAAGAGTKQQIRYDDVYAAASTLVEAGISDPSRLGYVGSSAGTTIAGVAITQQPTVFAVVTPQFGAFDFAKTLGYSVQRRNLSEAEYRRQVEQIVRLSPLQNVRRGVPYPAVFIMQGANDPLGSPGSARKFAARLQVAASARGPALIRIYPDMGHSTAPTLDPFAEFYADWLLFVLTHLGIDSKTFR